MNKLKRCPYKRTTVNKRTVLIHRHIMEQYLERKLESNEVVHHINHNKTDNRIENLKIMNDSEHRKIHAMGNKNCVGRVLSKETKAKLSKIRKGTRLGVNNPNHKLSEQDVIAIRQLAKQGITHDNIAILYSVRQSTITNIISYFSWKHVKEKSGECEK